MPFAFESGGTRVGSCRSPTDRTSHRVGRDRCRRARGSPAGRRWPSLRRDAMSCNVVRETIREWSWVWGKGSINYVARDIGNDGLPAHFQAIFFVVETLGMRCYAGWSLTAPGPPRKWTHGKCNGYHGTLHACRTRKLN